MLLDCLQLQTEQAQHVATGLQASPDPPSMHAKVRFFPHLLQTCFSLSNEACSASLQAFHVSCSTNRAQLLKSMLALLGEKGANNMSAYELKDGSGRAIKEGTTRDAQNCSEQLQLSGQLYTLKSGMLPANPP